jgi:hypothetical protein
MENIKTLFVTPNEKLLCIKGTEHLFSVCHKTSDFVTETVAENIEEKTAHLFASAPDLLSALENLMARCVKDAEHYAPDGNEAIWAYISDASDAIAKAKGKA